MEPVNISSLDRSVVPVRLTKTHNEVDSGQTASFSHWLQNSLSQVNDMQQNADSAARQLVAGENKDVHNTMIEMQKADIALNLVMEVRNKVISAYEEIKRMQF